jgi:hypothetical protein
MEEEYRLQKAHSEHHAHGHQDSLSHHVIHEDGSVLPGKQRPIASVADANGGADDDASVRAVKESPTHRSPQASLAANDIPTIRISTESDGDRESEAAAKEQGQRDGQEENNEEETENTEGEDEDPTKVNGTRAVIHDTLEKPVQAAADNPSGADDAPPTPTDAFSFSNKRLCERWLDNLFMVLYEVRSGTLGPSHYELNSISGSASLDHLQGRSCSLQDSTYSLQEDWDGVGDPRRFRAQTEPQRGGEGGVPKMPRFDAVLAQAVAQASGNVFRGR